MKAIVFTKYGSPSLLKLKDVAKPVPKNGEVLIKIHVSSINSWDWEFLNGVPFVNRLMFGLLRPKPGKQILGADIAGTVEANHADSTSPLLHFLIPLHFCEKEPRLGFNPASLPISA